MPYGRDENGLLRMFQFSLENWPIDMTENIAYAKSALDNKNVDRIISRDHWLMIIIEAK